MSNRQEVYRAIDVERNYQIESCKDNAHPVGSFLTLIRAYSAKADKAWTENTNDDEALDVIRKIAAISVACLEKNGIVHRSPMHPKIDNRLREELLK